MTTPVSTKAVQRPVAGTHGQGSIPWTGMSAWCAATYMAPALNARECSQWDRQGARRRMITLVGPASGGLR